MEVPPEIQARYVERKKKDLDACMTALAEGDFSQIEKLGHQLKGNGVTFGHPELSEVGKRLEQAAIAKDVDRMRSLLEEFSNWITVNTEKYKT